MSLRAQKVEPNLPATSTICVTSTNLYRVITYSYPFARVKSGLPHNYRGKIESTCAPLSQSPDPSEAFPSENRVRGQSFSLENPVLPGVSEACSQRLNRQGFGGSARQSRFPVLRGPAFM